MKIRELFEEKNGMKVSDIGTINGKKILLKNQVRDTWEGKFDLFLHGNKITSWEGIPKRINGYLNANSNSGLTSWEFAPEYAESVYLNLENIPTLVGIPKSKSSSLLHGKMKNLNGLHDETYSLDFGYFNNLSSVLGLPKGPVNNVEFWQCNALNFPLEPIGVKIEVNLSFSECAGITNFKNVHKTVSECREIIILDCVNVKSNILGFLKIKNLKKIVNSRNNTDFDNAVKIIKKYLPNPTMEQIIDCQNELIEAGFEKYAEL